MSNKFELLARWGYAARGVVYVILGAIAVTGASSAGGGETSTGGALSTLLQQPFGRVLLAAVAIGLIGYVLWRFAQAFFDADGKGSGVKGYAARAAQLAAGLANLSLAAAAVSLVLANTGGSGSSGEVSLSAWLMQQPFGRFLVGAVGLTIIVAGLVQAWRGLSGKYRERVKLPPEHEAVLHPLSAFGLAARGVLLAVTGMFFIFAAFTVDPNQAGGLSEGLEWIRQLPFGPYLYGLAAAGLVAFGLYSFIEGRYRVVNAPDAGDLKQAAGKVADVRP
jgi:hypothetical protein